MEKEGKAKDLLLKQNKGNPVGLPLFSAKRDRFSCQLIDI